jgi:signal transduction histidine kinase
VNRFVRRLSVRWHLALTYLLIIWVTLAVLMWVFARSLEKSGLDGRKAYLYAQAHFLASAIESRGGPDRASIASVGGIPARGRVLVIDDRGVVLQDSAADPDILGKDLSGLSEVRGALSGEQMANTYYLEDGTYVMYLAVPGVWGSGTGAIFISQDLNDILSQHRSLMRAVILGGIAASLAALLVAWVLAGVVTGPITEMETTARRMSAGRLDLRVKPGGPRETRMLAESFNSMARGIGESLKRQQEFLLAAAHDLRSPLAAVRVLVESMQMKAPNQDELPELLLDIRGEVDRTIRTTEGILNLLRTEGQFPEDTVDPREILHELVETRSKTAVGVTVTLKSDSGKCRMSALALRLVAANLLENAIRYSLPGGQVDVECSIQGRDLVLVVKDCGIGIDPKYIPRIFDRFYRVDEARQKSTGGAGLGLAIVKEVCDRTNATISVESAPGQGSTFTVKWAACGTEETPENPDSRLEP